MMATGGYGITELMKMVNDNIQDQLPPLSFPRVHWAQPRDGGQGRNAGQNSISRVGLE